MGELLPLIALGLMFAAMVRNLGRRKSAKERPKNEPAPAEVEPAAPLAELARRARLSVRGDQASGVVRGVLVTVTSAGGRLSLSAPLSLQLGAVRRIAPRPAYDSSGVRFSVSPGFDRALVIDLDSGATPELVRAELSGALTSALLRAALEGLEPELTATTIRLSLPSNRRAHEHQSALGQLVTIANAAATRADPEPESPRQRRVFAVWSRLGPVEEASTRLTLERSSGTFELELDADARETRIDLTFASPVATDLAVISAEPHAEPLEDLELGDADFDRMFVIGGDEDEARRELGPEVREALLVLVRDGAAVEVRPDVLTVTVPGALDRETAVESWIGAMERVAAAFAERLERSAYR